MDFLAELETMAGNAERSDDGEPSDAVVDMWRRLFSYTAEEALGKIKDQRANLNRARISSEHWDLVRAEKEAQGYDREAYEHALSRHHARHALPATTASQESAGNERMRYLLKLGGPLDSPEKVRDVIKREGRLVVRTGFNDNDQDHSVSQFCEIQSREKQKVLDFLNRLQYTPTLVPLRVAEKELCSHSIHPTLGLDATMPQFALESPNSVVYPQQNQYPVWYFFYGTLVDTAKLFRLCGEVTGPLITASIQRGILKTWAGKCRALLDGPEDARVVGAAYLVTCEEHEYALRVNETTNYEVVRCEIRFDSSGESHVGCTFRFSGPSWGLS